MWNRVALLVGMKLKIEAGRVARLKRMRIGDVALLLLGWHSRRKNEASRGAFGEPEPEPRVHSTAHVASHRAVMLYLTRGTDFCFQILHFKLSMYTRKQVICTLQVIPLSN